MNIDLEHIHHWMRAIRESHDTHRTLDAFWSGQIKSKEWLIRNLRPWIFQKYGIQNVSIDIHGGWVGVLASMIFQSDIPVDTIQSFDIDPSCEKIATIMNQIEHDQQRFTAITQDMCSTASSAHVIINTSCEHISQTQFDIWKNNLPDNRLVLLQSNNYEIPEHIRISNSLTEFEEQSNLSKILYRGELTLPLYTRWMLVGIK
jgi:hypothetical protein